MDTKGGSSATSSTEVCFAQCVCAMWACDNVVCTRAWCRSSVLRSESHQASDLDGCTRQAFHLGLALIDCFIQHCIITPRASVLRTYRDPSACCYQDVTGPVREAALLTSFLNGRSGWC
eukprot:1989391-Pyramimonas_sp.AAC.2